MRKVYTVKSKLQLLGTALTFFGLLYDQLPVFQQYIPPEWYGRIFVGVGVIVIALRAVTTKPLDEK